MPTQSKPSAPTGATLDSADLAGHIDAVATPLFIAWIDPKETDNLAELIEEPFMDALEAAFHVGFMRGLEFAGRSLVCRPTSVPDEPDDDDGESSRGAPS